MTKDNIDIFEELAGQLLIRSKFQSIDQYF